MFRELKGEKANVFHRTQHSVPLTNFLALSMLQFGLEVFILTSQMRPMTSEIVGNASEKKNDSNTYSNTLIVAFVKNKKHKVIF